LALHEARNAECTEAVLRSCSAANRTQLLGWRGQDGSTPLHRVCARPETGRDIAEMFVDMFSDALELPDSLGETPIFTAVSVLKKKLFC
jgi:ankyrin repeat protein